MHGMDRCFLALEDIGLLEALYICTDNNHTDILASIGITAERIIYHQGN
jgi:hypothetical protein